MTRQTAGNNGPVPGLPKDWVLRLLVSLDIGYLDCPIGDRWPSEEVGNPCSIIHAFNDSSFDQCVGNLCHIFLVQTYYIVKNFL